MAETREKMRQTDQVIKRGSDRNLQTQVLAAGTVLLSRYELNQHAISARLFIKNADAAQTVTAILYASCLANPNVDPTTSDWVALGSPLVVGPAAAGSSKFDVTGFRWYAVRATATADTGATDVDCVVVKSNK